jgi:hypothetical protein
MPDVNEADVGATHTPGFALYERRMANIPYEDMFAFTLFRGVLALVS